MVRPGDLCILHAFGTIDLLPRLDSHLDMGNQDVALSRADLRLLHDEPLPCPPVILVPLLLGKIEGAHHAHDRLLMLTHGELLQVVVRLEHHLTNTRAGQPLWLEALHLPKVLNLVGLGGGCALHVQGEQRLAALLHPDTERKGKILQIDRRGRVNCRQDQELRALQHQAAHALWDLLALQPARQVHVAGHQLLLPADVVLRPLLPLQVGVVAQARLFVLLGLSQHELGLALAVQEGGLAAACVAKVADGQATLRAEAHLLTVGVLCCVLVLALGGHHKVPPHGLLPSLGSKVHFHGIQVFRGAGTARHRHVHRAHRCHL
mmetsp:Transcript_151806/g.368699  ORF Transcript_151806/g.368699 Transcript_151806/m.368699 type:complete len:320 (+) Transcript_151806:1609-2568(+)